MREIIKKIAELYKPFKRVIITVFFLMIIQQAISLISPYIYGKIIDGMVSKKPFNQILALAFVALAVYVTGSLIGFFRDRFEIRNFDFKIFHQVSREVLKKLFGLSVGQHLNENSGLKQSIIDRGESSLTSFAYTMLYETIPMLLQVILTVAVIFYLNAILGIIVLAGALVFILTSIYSNISMRGAHQKLEDMRDDMDLAHNEILRNMQLVQFSAQEHKVAAGYDNAWQKFAAQGIKIWSRYCRHSFGRNLTINLTRFLTMAVGIWFVFTGKYTPGYLVIILSWSSEAFGRLGGFGSLHRRLTEQYNAIKKLFAILQIESDVKVLPNPVRPGQLDGRIEFRNVSFAYPARKCIDEKDGATIESMAVEPRESLSGVDLTIFAGEKVALVGLSGAGKSTIVNLLLRAYDPDRGQILIDGHDLRLLDLAWLRQQIGIVPQSVDVFDNTLGYNIAFDLDSQPDKEKLDEACRLARVDQFFHRMENGFETLIGERGVKLSGGERQRVGIARALIKNPRIMIFDEATSNLDTENEAVIRSSIEEAARGRTTMIIAHRLSTVKNADRIFVVDDGRIVATGRHEKLLETSEVYRRLVGSQLVH